MEDVLDAPDRPGQEMVRRQAAKLISSARRDEAAPLCPETCRRVCWDHIEGRVEEQDRHRDEADVG
jgi:hypothetical protein